MIFATVGTQLPFDRMIQSLDKWLQNQEVKDCFAQISDSQYKPKHMKFAPFLSPSEFANLLANCKVIVSHAGMGTVLSALQIQKPIIIMPRLAAYGEHRNDHQLATTEGLSNREGIHIANSSAELHEYLDNYQDLTAGVEIYNGAAPSLISQVSDFIKSA
ncbi:glycosyltransferase [Temperatibacter marinus]|uniref:Glycosyltransferase n=1 Tax=Temperatibacter marinus TaxID=1456591 RepID=A0AA52EEE8_9PROT|nr:glycosyltransferase [Temperatibacter marinus]WND03271.1 glycosyltransferase [Temperatibacter marinus]